MARRSRPFGNRDRPDTACCYTSGGSGTKPAALGCRGQQCRRQLDVDGARVRVIDERNASITLYRICVARCRVVHTTHRTATGVRCVPVLRQLPTAPTSARLNHRPRRTHFGGLTFRNVSARIGRARLTMSLPGRVDDAAATSAGSFARRRGGLISAWGVGRGLRKVLEQLCRAVTHIGDLFGHRLAVHPTFRFSVKSAGNPAQVLGKGHHPLLHGVGRRATARSFCCVCALCHRATSRVRSSSRVRSRPEFNAACITLKREVMPVLDRRRSSGLVVWPRRSASLGCPGRRHTVIGLRPGERGTDLR
jgi:hypothetical protein